MFYQKTIHDGDPYAYISCRFPENKVSWGQEGGHGLVHTVKPSANFSLIGYTRHLRREGMGVSKNKFPSDGAPSYSFITKTRQAQLSRQAPYILITFRLKSQ